MPTRSAHLNNVILLHSMKVHAMQLSIWFLSILMLLTVASMAMATDIYFGTVANNADQPSGVYVSKFDAAKKKLHRASLLLELNDAGWVVNHPTLKVLYSTGNVEGQSAVVAIDISGDQAKQINSQEIGKGESCYVTPDQSGQLLISAQYSGSSIAVFPLGENGSVQPRSQLISHPGASRVHKNQEAAHPHYVGISPDNRFAFVCDLGIDKIVGYEIDLEAKQLKEVSQTAAIPGGGPRHMKFTPDGKFALVLNELTLSISVFQYDSQTGQLTMTGTTAALTSNEMALNRFNSGSEIRIHPSGKFVYSANRGHDSITNYEFDSVSGSLKRIGIKSIRGSWPRNFNLTPAGDFLLAAGKDSNSVSIFSIDQETGGLQYLQHSSIFVPAPICVLPIESSGD